MDGTISRLGGKTYDSEGYDLIGLITGSEGFLCVITEVTVKILKNLTDSKSGTNWIFHYRRMVVIVFLKLLQVE